jgi:predicted nucleic-acid-binding protein
MTNLYVIDANAILRYLLKDDLTQAAIIEEIFKKKKNSESDFYVTREVVMECVCTLSKFYKVSRDDIYAALKSFLNTKMIVLEERGFIMEALDYFSTSGISYVDCLVIIKTKKLNAKLITFDKKLISKIES